MTTLLGLYHGTPAWMQDAALSLYGMHLRYVRYGRGHRAHVDMLVRDQHATPAALDEAQRLALRGVVRHAAATVPMYRARGLHRDDADTTERFRAIPRLTKAAVQEAGRAMIASDAPRQLEEVHTGGTTGTPLTIFCDRATLRRNYAFFERFKRTAGIQNGERTATFAGRLVVPPTAARRFWRHNRASHTELFSSYHLMPNNYDAYLGELAAFAPSLIDAYPSSIEPLARHVLARGGTSVRPSAIITSSETLLPDARHSLESAFACPVFDYYGAAEMAALITQCERGAYHVNSDFGLVEILVDGQPAAPGQEGDIVATGFINPIMPFIRYDTGDRAVAGSAPCRCGRGWPVIDRIVGRLDDVIITPDGRRVGRLDPIFKTVSSIHEAQIVQDATDHVVLRYVATTALPSHERDALLSQLRLRLGASMRCDVTRVEQIARTARGKLRTVVRTVALTS